MLLAHRGQLDHRVQKALQVHRERPDRRVHKEPLDQLAPKERREVKVQQDLRAYRVLLV